MQNVSYFGNAETIKGKGNGETQTCEYPNKYRDMAVNDKWQRVADVKSTIFTVTVYSGGFRICYPPHLTIIAFENQARFVDSTVC